MFCKEKNFFFTMKRKNFPKVAFFQRGSPMLWSKNANFFHYLFSLKIRLEIRFKNLLDTKEPFFDYKKKILSVLKMAFFQRG